MSRDERAFAGFAGLSQGTVIPNLFFTAVLPRMSQPGELLAFLWLARLVQAQKSEARFATADQVWAQDGSSGSFEAIGRGRGGLDEGLAACVEIGAVLGLRLTGSTGEQVVYFLNNPSSQRIVGRVRGGELRLIPDTVATPLPTEDRPGIFRLYEENIGTITPLAGERLLAAAEAYPASWIHEAFQAAVDMNVRNWRYIERILQRWSEEGRDERTEGDSLEDRKRRYLGGDLGHIVRYR